MSELQRQSIAAWIDERRRNNTSYGITPRNDAAESPRDFTASVPAGTSMVQTDAGDIIPMPGVDHAATERKNAEPENIDGGADLTNPAARNLYQQTADPGRIVPPSGNFGSVDDNHLFAPQPGITEAVRSITPKDILENQLKRWNENDSDENLARVIQTLGTEGGRKAFDEMQGNRADIEQARRELDEEVRKRKPGWDAQYQENRKKNDHWTNTLMGYSGQAAIDDANISREEKDFNLASRLLDAAQYRAETVSRLEQEIAEATGNEKSGSTQRFMHGLKPETLNNLLTAGWGETADLLRVSQIADKAARGEQLTDGEKQAAGAYVLSLDAASRLENLGGATWMEKAGQMIGDNMPFLLEMAITGGFGGAAAGAARGLMRKGIAAGVRAGLRNRAGRYVAKQGANLLGAMVGGAATAPFSNATWGDFAQRNVDQYDISQGVNGEIEAVESRPESLVSRVAKSLGTGTAELGSEYWGGFAGAGRLFPQALRGTRVARITEPLRRLAYTPSVQRLDRYVGNIFKWDGLPMEYAEEQLNNIIGPLMAGEPERIRENFSSEAQLETLLGVVAMGGVFQTIGTGAAAYDHVQSRRRSAGLLGHIQNPDIRQQVARAMGHFTQQQQAKAISNIDWDNASLHDMAATTDYIMHRTQGRVAQEMQRAMQEQQEAKMATLQFEQFKNRDTGQLEEVFDTQGNRFYLAGGTIERSGEETADGTVFVVDPVSGEASQKSIDELKRGTTTPYEAYEQEALERIRTVSQAQAEAEAVEEIMQGADATHSDPMPMIADYKGIDLSTLSGKTVTLRDGSTAFVNSVTANGNDFTEIDIVPLDPATGMTRTGENGEEIHRLLNVADVTAVDGVPVGPETVAAQTTPSEGEGVASQTPELQNGQQGTLDDGEQTNIDPAQGGAIDGTPVGTQNAGMENAAIGPMGQVGAENPGMNPELGNTTTSGVHNVSDPRIGRSLTSQEADELIREMQNEAQPAPELELTPENWMAEFGENGIINTPIGDVKQGENQYLKLAQQGRNGKLGMVKPTLESPAIILEDARPAKDGKSERDTSYVFVKPFAKQDGSRYYYFTSVTVSKNGREVVISSQERSENRISKLLQQSNVAWIDSAFSLYPTAQVEGSVPLNDSNRPTATDNQPALLGVNSSELSVNKDTNSVPSEQEIPRKKDGKPDYAAMEPNAMFRAIAEDFGEDVAREQVAQQISIYEGKIKKLSNSRSENINTRLENLTKIKELQEKVNALREAAGIFEEETAETAPKTKTEYGRRATLREQSRALGDYLSVEDKILRDIAEGLKFRWSDNGTQRGLGTELGFSDSPAERKARFNILSNDGTTVDRYAESLEHDMDRGVIPMAMDADMRSAILDVLSRVRSNREAFDAAMALREDDPRSSMTEEEARLQAEYNASRASVVPEVQQEETKPVENTTEQVESPAEQEAGMDAQVPDFPFRRSEAEGEAIGLDFSPEHRQAVEEMVEELNQELGENVVVFAELEELPEKVRDDVRKAMEDGYMVQGLTFNHVCYLYAPAITDKQTADYVYTHELAGHKNVEAAFSDRTSFAAFCDRLVDDIGVSEMAENIDDTGFMDCVNAYFANPDARNKYALGREYIAYLTENSNARDLYEADYEGDFSLPSYREFITTDTLNDLIHYANSRQGRGVSQGQGRMGEQTETETGYRRADGTAGLGTSNADRLSGGGQTADSGRSRPDGVPGSGTDHALPNAAGNIPGRASADEGGNGSVGSRGTGAEEHQGSVSGQDDTGVDRDQPGTLPAGETVTQDDGPATRNDDIRFRRTQQPQEETASLIAVHNTTEDQLKKSLELGGFPMPSIAITHAEMGHTEFGEISLLFDRTSIDPVNRQNKVYGGDAWTPTFPSVGYKLNEDKTSAIYHRANKVKNLPLFNPVTFHPDNYERHVNGLDTGGLVEHFKDNYDAKQFYLAENGNAVTEYEQHEVEKYPADKIPIYEDVLKRIGVERIVNGDIDSVRDEVREILEQHGIGLSQMKPNVAGVRVNNTIKAALDYAENGNRKAETDIEATKRKIDERIDQQRFEAWLHELFNGVVEKKGIRNDRDAFTPSGNSRKWEALYDEVTLDNIVKAMQRQAARGGQGLFGGSIFGASQKEYPSIDEIREEAKRVIKNISNDEIEAQKNAITDRLSDVKIPGVGSSFSDTMDMAENIKDAVARSHTAKGIYRYLKEFYSGMTMEVAEEIADIVRDIQQMSSRYFEAKPQRAVGFDEVRLAVVPVDTDAELIRQLERRGIAVRTYARGNEEQRREIVANATEELNIRFRRAYHGSGADFDRFDHSFMGTGEGAQAFGWGTYVSEVDGIARSYAENAGNERGRTPLLNGKRVDEKPVNMYSSEEAAAKAYATYLPENRDDAIKNAEQNIAYFKEYAEKYPDNAEAVTGIIAMWEKALEYFQKHGIRELGYESNRHLYTVEIPDDTGQNYLRWNEELSDTEINRALGTLEQIDDPEFDFDYFSEKLEQYQDVYNLTGEGLYKLLSRYGFDHNGQKASEALSRAGYAGIEYPAQVTTGGRGDGAKNYVVFNAEDVKITDHVRFRNMAEANAAALSPEEINERFNEELKTLSPENAQSRILWLGNPSEVLQAAGVRNMPIKLYGNKLIKKMNKHGFKLEELKDLPKAVASPIFVFAGNRTGSYAILTELRIEQGNVLTVIDVDKNGEADVNMVSSVFGKADNEVLRWIDAGKLRWVDKEKAQDYISAPALSAGATRNTEAFSSTTNILENFENPTRLDGEKVAAAEEMAAELGVPVRIVRDRSEIGDTESMARDKRGSEGWHDRRSGEIAVVLPNCRDAAEVQKTILHEAVGHYGIPELLGRERADEFYRRVFRSLDDATQARLLAEHGSETVAGDEYLAEMAEGDVTPSVWKRIMAAIRGFFRDVLGIDLKVTDAEMRYILWRSKNNLARARTVSEAMDTIAQDIRMRAQTEREAARERKAQQLEKLRASEPLMFTGDEYKGLYELNSRAAGQYIVDHLRGTYTNADSGEIIYVSRKAQKVAHHDAENKVHLQSVAYIPQMLENAILIDEVPNAKSSTGFDSYRYYVVGLKINGVDYTAKLVVGEKNGQIYYDHALTEIEKGDLIDQRDLVKAQVYDDKAANAVTGTPVATVKDKRLLQILQPEPLKYQQKSEKNAQQEPQTPMQYVDRVAEEMAAQDNEIRFRRKKQQPAADAPIRTTRDNWATRIGRKLQDAHIPVRQLQDYIRAHGGTVGIVNDLYSALNRALGRQMERIRRADAEFAEVARKMRKIKRDYGYKYTQIVDYLAAKSSIERHASGIPAYSDEADAPWNKLTVEKLVADFERTVPAGQVEELWQEIRKITDKQLELMRNYGLISVQTLRDIRDRGWKYYMPLQGVDFDFEQKADPHEIFGEILTERRGGNGLLMHRAKGRTTKPDDVLATLQRNVHLTIMTGEQNLAKQFLLRLAEANPELQGDTRTGQGVFEIEEEWWVRRDPARITPEERERGEVYERTIERPADSEIEQSQLAVAEKRKLEQELETVEKELWKLDVENANNDELSALLDRRRELSEQIQAAFERITAVRMLPRGGHAYRGLSTAEEQMHVVPVYRNGIRTVVRMSDPIVAQAVNGNFKELFGGIMANVVNVIGKGTRWMASTSTSWNPEFLLKNTVRDSLWASFYNWVDKEGDARGYLRNYPVAQRTIVRYHTGKASPLSLNERARYNIYTPEGAAAAIEAFGLSRVRDSWFDDFLMEGGLTGYAYMQEVSDYSKKLARKVRWMSNAAGNTVHGLREAMETMSDLSEVTTRFATFLAQIQKGADIRTAVNYARDITINFNRRGEWGRDLNSLYMFFNAATQGIANFYNLTRRNKARMGFAVAGILGLSYTTSLLLAQFLAADDDDEEWSISDYQRYTNLCLPGWIVGSDDKVVLIPLPQELRPMWVAGTVAADVTGGRIDAKDAWGVFSNATGTVLEAAGEAYLPVEVSLEHPMRTFVPSVFKPFYELYTNADFTGFPIYREPFAQSLEGRIPESQLGMRNANKLISGVTEWLNEKGGGNKWTPAGVDPATGEMNGLINLMDQNPSKIEHLITSYTGGLGRMGARIYRYCSSPDEERVVRDIPFINAFLTDVRKEINPNTEYYDIRQKYESLDYWARNNWKNGEIPPYYNSPEEANRAQQETAIVMGMIKKSEKQLKALKKRMETTDADSPEYRELARQMTEVRRNFINEYDQFIETYDHATEN